MNSMTSLARSEAQDVIAALLGWSSAIPDCAEKAELTAILASWGGERDWTTIASQIDTLGFWATAPHQSCAFPGAHHGVTINGMSRGRVRAGFDALADLARAEAAPDERIQRGSHVVWALVHARAFKSGDLRPSYIERQLRDVLETT